MIHWKRLWCWEGLGAGGEGDDRGWDGWMGSLTQWAWVWVNSGMDKVMMYWWWTRRLGVLRFTGSQRVRHDCASTKLTVQDSTLAKGLDSRFVASRAHCSLHHTAWSPGGGLAGSDICYLTAPLCQVYMGGTPELLQVRSTVLRCGRRWVLESAFHVAEEFQMSPLACHWYLSSFWLKGMFPIKMWNFGWGGIYGKCFDNLTSSSSNDIS